MTGGNLFLRELLAVLPLAELQFLSPEDYLSRGPARVAADFDVVILDGVLPEGGVLPPGRCVRIDPAAWVVPPVFRAIQRAAAVDDAEMRRTFNMGVGFVLIVSPADVEPAVKRLQRDGERCFEIGRVVAGEPGVEYA